MILLISVFYLPDLSDVYRISLSLSEEILFIYIYLIKKIFFFFRATPEAYRGSQARGLNRAVAAGLHHSHSNARSELHWQPTHQLTAKLDP